MYTIMQIEHKVWRADGKINLANECRSRPVPEAAASFSAAAAALTS